MTGALAGEGMTMLRLGDIDVAVRSVGTGPRVVLVHGLAQDRSCWEPQFRDLTGHQVIAYDVRGHGGTSLGDADGTAAQLGSDLVALLEAVGPSICVGFSLGGTIVLWAAAQRPDLIPAAMVVATSSVVGRAAQASYLERIERVRAGGRAALEQMLRDDSHAALANADRDVQAIVARRVQAVGDGAGYCNGAAAMARVRDEPINDLLDRIAAPVEVVGGELDQFCPRRAADIMLERLPNASYVELPGVAHLMTDDDPAALTAAIQRFLATQDPH
jgi:pimeloyl-ACP methyl ester carboxylesterase